MHKKYYESSQKYEHKDKEAMAELEAMKVQAEIEEQNKEIVRRYIEEWNKGNTEVHKEFNAPDCVFYMPSNRPHSKSEEEKIEDIKIQSRAFPDINWSIEELFAVRDRVIVRGILTGTHEGEFQGIPATGNKFEVGVIAIYQIKKGKIIEERIDMDTLGMVEALGMELKPKEEK